MLVRFLIRFLNPARHILVRVSSTTLMVAILLILLSSTGFAQDQSDKAGQETEVESTETESARIEKSATGERDEPASCTRRVIRSSEKPDNGSASVVTLDVARGADGSSAELLRKPLQARAHDIMECVPPNSDASVSLRLGVTFRNRNLWGFWLSSESGNTLTDQEATCVTTVLLEAGLVPPIPNKPKSLVVDTVWIQGRHNPDSVSDTISKRRCESMRAIQDSLRKRYVKRQSYVLNRLISMYGPSVLLDKCRQKPPAEKCPSQVSIGVLVNPSGSIISADIVPSEAAEVCTSRVPCVTSVYEGYNITTDAEGEGDFYVYVVRLMMIK